MKLKLHLKLLLLAFCTLSACKKAAKGPEETDKPKAVFSFTKTGTTGFAYGGTSAIDFSYDGTDAVTPIVPAGWTATVDIAAKKMTVTAPASGSSAALNTEIKVNTYADGNPVTVSAKIAVIQGQITLSSADFSKSFVHNVFKDNVKVAEITREYVRGYHNDELGTYDTTKVATVVYPYNATDKKYSDGILAETGGKIKHTGAVGRYTPLAVAKASSSVSLCADGSIIGELNNTVTRLTALTVTPDQATDNSGNKYKVAKVGSLYWLAENLKTNKYNDGSPIGNASGETITIGAADAPDAAYISKFGYLYNWYAVSDPKGIAPTGYHVATSVEWSGLDGESTFDRYLGWTRPLWQVASRLYWSGETPFNNLAKLGLLPGGIRLANGTFGDIGTVGNYWTPNTSGAEGVKVEIGTNTTGVTTTARNKYYGYSVRCVRTL